MRVFQISVPVPNYEGTDVHFVRHLFRRCPTQEEFLEYLYRIKQKEIDAYADLEMGIDSEWFDEQIEATRCVDEWNILHLSGGPRATNTFITHHKFGEIPFSWTIVEIEENE